MPDESATTEVIPAKRASREERRALARQMADRSMRSQVQILDGIDEIGGPNWQAAEFHDILASAKEKEDHRLRRDLLKDYMAMLEAAGAAGQRSLSDLSDDEVDAQLEAALTTLRQKNPELLEEILPQLAASSNDKEPADG